MSATTTSLSNQKMFLETGATLIGKRIEKYDAELQQYIRDFIVLHGFDEETVTKNNSHRGYLRIKDNKLELVLTLPQPLRTETQDMGTYTYGNNGYDAFTKKEHVLLAYMNSICLNKQNA